MSTCRLFWRIVLLQALLFGQIGLIHAQCTLPTSNDLDQYRNYISCAIDACKSNTLGSSCTAIATEPIFEVTSDTEWWVQKLVAEASLDAYLAAGITYTFPGYCASGVDCQNRDKTCLVSPMQYKLSSASCNSYDTYSWRCGWKPTNWIVQSSARSNSPDPAYVPASFYFLIGAYGVSDLQWPNGQLNWCSGSNVYYQSLKLIPQSVLPCQMVHSTDNALRCRMSLCVRNSYYQTGAVASNTYDPNAATNYCGKNVQYGGAALQWTAQCQGPSGSPSSMGNNGWETPYISQCRYAYDANGCIVYTVNEGYTGPVNCQNNGNEYDTTPPPNSIPAWPTDGGPGYFLGASTTTYENYQCNSGYKKCQSMNYQMVSNVKCNVDRQNQCVVPDATGNLNPALTNNCANSYASGPSQTIECGGHGTCGDDIAFNSDSSKVNNDSLSNDLRLRCTCDAGWFPADAITGVPYCSKTCMDYQNNAQTACRTHGTCDVIQGACTCSSGWFGGACEFPTTDVDHTNDAFLFTVQSQGSPPTDSTTFYSVLFYNAATPTVGSASRLVSEPTTGTTMTQTIVGSPAIAIYQHGYVSTGTKLNFSPNLYTTLDPYLSSCTLPFFRHPTTKLCVAPQTLPAPIAVYSVAYELAPTIGCLQLPSDHPAIPLTVVKPEDNFGYYCWTASAFANAAPSASALGAGSLVVSCAFRRASGFVTVLTTPQLAWSAIYAAMSDYGCV